MATTNYTSRRQYLSQDELAQFADITVTDATEADDQISQAEEIIDGYVGFQRKAVNSDIFGRVSAATGSSFTLEAARHIGVFQKGFFLYCEVEIIRGTGAGQRRIISDNSYTTGVVTVRDAWTTTPDSTSYYRIYQLGKFPRAKDVWFDGNIDPQVYAKSIPEAIKRAVAAQVEYMISMGSSFFASDMSEVVSESIGDYSYTKSPPRGFGSSSQLIAPKAKMLLKGYINRKGVMVT